MENTPINIDYLRDEIDNYSMEVNDKTELNREGITYSSVDDMLDMKSGPFTVKVEDINFDCFYHVNEKNDRFPIKNLYVMYTSARSPADLQPKAIHFTRWSYYPMIDAMDSALLCIDDPMIKQYQDKDFILAWYYGTENKSYIKVSLKIITAICNMNHISYENVIFWGSSSSGYAGIYAASFLEGAMAVAMNPQIYIKLWSYAKEFEKITNINLESNDVHKRNDLISLINNNKSKYVIMFNAMSSNDWKNQLAPFCRDMQIFPHYGLTKKTTYSCGFIRQKGHLRHMVRLKHGIFS